MQQAGYKLAEVVYKQGSADGATSPDVAAAAAAAGASTATDSKDDGPIDANFEVVDDDKKSE